MQGHLRSAGTARARDHHLGRQRFDYKSLPDAGHNMNQIDPQMYTAILRDWISTLDD